MKYEPVIGLEIHVQLSTKTKMFCRCSADVFGKAPNSYTCPVCLGLPGALPVPNAEAIRKALLAGEALGATHPKVSKFDRKNYFYPDLPKGYQISQYDQPLNIGGTVTVNGRKIKLTRAHLEEDTGKLLHESGKTLVDFNRSGLPLMEIVSEPEINSPTEAKAYGQKVQLLMRYAGVSEADMEKGSLRVDANISLRPIGSKKLGTKVEVKNMNSFRSVERALEYEISRQNKLLASGERIVQETRGWNEGKQVTLTQRVKEGAEDYRYFPEPDLLGIELTPKVVTEIKKSLPEMPDAKKARFVREYNLALAAAETIISDPYLAAFFENGWLEFIKLSGTRDKSLASQVANWVIGAFLAEINRREVDWEKIPVTPAYLAELVYMFGQGKVTAQNARVVLTESFDTGQSPSEIITKKNLVLQSDAVKLAEVARRVIVQNPQAVSDFHHGKAQAFGFLLGQIQKETGGSSDPTIARQALEEELKRSSD